MILDAFLRRDQTFSFSSSEHPGEEKTPESTNKIYLQAATHQAREIHGGV